MTVSALEEYFLQGEILTLNKGARIVWHGDDIVALLTNGTLDFFLVDARHESPPQDLRPYTAPEIAPTNLLKGNYHFLTTVTATNLLWPFPPQAKEGVYIIAIAIETSTLLKHPIANCRFRTFLSEEFSKAASFWIHLFAPLFSSFQVAYVDTYMEPFAHRDVGENQLLLFPRDPLVSESIQTMWLSVINGELLFLGMPLLSLTAEAVPFPLLPSLWLYSTKPSYYSLDENLPPIDQRFWQGMLLFNRYVVHAAASLNDLVKLEDNLALAKKASLQWQYFYNISLLTQQLFRHKSGQRSLDHLQGIFQACQWVGEILHQPIPPYIGLLPNDKDLQVAVLAQHADVFYRRLQLPLLWWESDRGPLLGVFQDAFVSLQPKWLGGYLLRIPGNADQIPVDHAIAAELSPTAYLFYRAPAFQGPVTALQLLLFVLTGLKAELIVIMLLTVVIMITMICQAMMGLLLFDYTIPNSADNLVEQFPWALLILTFFTSLFIYSRHQVLMRLKTSFLFNSESLLWQTIFSLFKNFSYGYSSEELWRSIESLGSLRRLLSSFAVREAFNLLAIFLPLLTMLYLNLWGGIAIIAIFTGGIAYTLRIFLRSSRMSNNSIPLEGLLYRKTVEAIGGLTKIRSDHAEARFFASWMAEELKFKTLEMQEKSSKILAQTFFALLPLLGMAVIILLNVSPIKHAESFSVGEFIAFYILLTYLSNQMFLWQNFAFSAVGTIALWKNLQELCSTVAQEKTSKRLIRKGVVLNGDVRIDNVSFRYDLSGPWLHKDITIHAEVGEFIAIVGASGSGKSTLMRLLLGFAQPELGGIFYDGYNLEELNIKDVRGQIGAVMQNSAILQGTLRENITGGRPVGDQEVMKAIKLAAFDRELEKMADGLDTPLISGGSDLSAGQRQRIFLARALLGNPRILLLDEATNALDSDLQAIITKNLEHYYITRIVIAHRLSTIRHAHRIYVLSEGRIAQCGSFNELISQEGPFNKLLTKSIL
jgi:ATP-binding cassette subfamily C protein